MNVQILTFKGIPYQVKLNDGEEHRRQLDDRFINAVAEATLPEDNIIMGRKWEQSSTRYGTPEEVFTEVIEEINALHDDETLKEMVSEAKSKQPPKPKAYRKVNVEEFKAAADWKERLSLLDHMKNPDKDDYELLSLALRDEKMQVRRTAVYLLAMIEDSETLQYLKTGLEDKAVPVRRTAGDGYSDLGLKEGLQDMYPLLDDKSPIVRWRAAMFIYEVGDEESLPYLYEHKEDPQYDVRLQKEMAIARIEKGEAAMGSVWKQIQERER